MWNSVAVSESGNLVRLVSPQEHVKSWAERPSLLIHIYLSIYNGVCCVPLLVVDLLDDLCDLLQQLLPLEQELLQEVTVGADQVGGHLDNKTQAQPQPRWGI